MGALPGEGKRLGTGWLVGKLGCQAVSASVVFVGPSKSSCSLLGSLWREGDGGGGREAKGWAGWPTGRGQRQEGAGREEKREGAGGAEREGEREGRREGWGRPPGPPGSFKGSNFLVDGWASFPPPPSRPRRMGKGHTLTHTRTLGVSGQA